MTVGTTVRFRVTIARMRGLIPLSGGDMFGDSSDLRRRRVWATISFQGQGSDLDAVLPKSRACREHSPLWCHYGHAMERIRMIAASLTRRRSFPAGMALGMALLAGAAFAAQARAESVPERQIVKLQEQLAEVEGMESTSAIRRTCKRIVRGAESLLKKHPDAEERFQVMGMIFQARLILYSQKQSDEHVEALVKTAKELAQAPDDQAEFRLGADMLLLQIAMDRTEDPPEQAMQVARMADRYRDTPAEAESLMAASSLAFNLGHRYLLEAFRNALTQRFSQDRDVTAFLRERFSVAKPIPFVGVFKRADGKEISFPKGRRHVVCFWSRDAEDLDKKIEELVELQKKYKNEFKVYSLNLDELADGGARLLRQRKLDWVPLRLKGGLENPLFRSLGTTKLFAGLVISPLGYGEYVRSRTGHHHRGGAVQAIRSRYAAAGEDPRVRALWRYLLSGRFLIADSVLPERSSIPQSALGAIQSCLAPRFPRNFPSEMEELKNYRKADALLSAAITKHSSAPDLWVLHSHRIIALMGIWRMTGEVEHLKSAVATAQKLLALPLQPTAKLISNYCIAIAALQQEGTRPDEVIAFFDKQTDGVDASGLTVIASLMLALEGHLPDEYARYRDQLLTRHGNDAAVGWFTSFMLNPRVPARLFGPALPDGGKMVAPMPAFNRTFKADLTTIDGQHAAFPDQAADKMTAVVFLEKPADRTALKRQDDAVDYLAKVVRGRPLKDMQLMLIFRAPRPDDVKQRMTAKKWQCAAVALDDEEWGKLCWHYGVLSADREPGILVLRPDGSVAVALTELARPHGARPTPLNREVEPLLRSFELPLVEQAMQAKDYRLAVARLETTAPLAYRSKSRHEPNWLTPNQHRRKKVWCYMQLGEWPKALKTINTIISARLEHTPYIRGHIKTSKWCRSNCHGHLFNFCTRIRLLKELGRHEDAKQMFAIFKPHKCPLVDDLTGLWKAVDDRLAWMKKERPYRYKNPTHHLTNIETEMRHKQFLYNFDLESDYQTRAHILTKLGRHKEAEADRINAQLRAWPHAPREYDIGRTREAAENRRDRAAGLLASGQWEEAKALLDINIEVHEEGPKQCSFQCRYCGDQRQGLELRAKSLRSAGRDREAEISQALAEALKCPADDKERDSKWFFPAGRVGWGNGRKQHLGYIDEYLRGGVHAIEATRRVRFELAGYLALRAQALEQLGKKDEAAKDRKRSRALTYLAGPTWQRPHGNQREPVPLPKRYVDILATE